MAIQDKYGVALSLHEKLILKAIYDMGGKNIPTKSIGPYLEKHFGCDYARTTIVTFLQRMVKKGYVISYRDGRDSFQSATMPFEAYIAECMNDFCELWFDGNKNKMMKCIRNT
ncbi:MAG: BlaI/MecI/CopY family transcriptional regulator [Agathobacter sp.]